MDDMVLVPGARFDQGTPEHVLDWLLTQPQTLPRIWFADETPRRPVTVAPYLIDRHPVTVAQFREFTRRTGYRTDAEERGFGLVYDVDGWVERPGVAWHSPGGPDTGSPDYDDHPVVHVSWRDATSYAAWAGKRLPSEPEWELAARGPEFRIWPWGDDWDPYRANTAELHAGRLDDLGAWQRWWRKECEGSGPVPRTTPVGFFSPHGDSAAGCADMAGNVYEWTATLSHLYDPSTRCDPTVNRVMGRYRVIRGGSWMNFRYQVRCSERMHGDPLGWSSFAHGFRCARTPVEDR
ncbi:SUMF1/EgtB/PvdO family nonheme iron enzyme [Actinoplanes sp. LDG1-06]|uniref:SUMF1/EgtB/PvdO family nonheme iron enzyme n=1 Tax=Paractinoplanes ovalisporus TaxID=2810368 RepID=A0ABS2AJZ5_9ACTN|nr:SUMF1/EgtB/PvdO family nonheme iron enzyme [Actinoplanes ovalisporus]MBM2620103.1 SUMF1/EgtB/PvdO family nonheme iron enzyme [Actinoplanes ovalisporus]